MSFIIHSLSKYLSNHCYVPGPVLGTGVQGTKQIKITALVVILVRRDRQYTIVKIYKYTLSILVVSDKKIWQCKSVHTCVCVCMRVPMHAGG